MLVHPHTTDHLPTDTAYARFNKRVAIWVTNKVGTMTCAWVFSVLALLSLPAVLSGFAAFKHMFPHWMVSASLIALVAWIAQTYVQLVLLSVIMVGQNIQSAAADARAAKTFDDTERLLSLMDTHTEGGLKDVLDAIQALAPAKEMSDGTAR